MSKKYASPRQKSGKPQRKGSNRRKIVIALALLLSIAGIIAAQWGGTSPLRARMASAPLSPPPSPTFSPSSPSKEYIYAGGRLVATEEPSNRTNVALASNGGVASASSFTTGYSPAGAINGDRKGLNGGQNGFWATNWAGFPAWMEVAFNGTKAIEEIDLFTIQNNYTSPSEPTTSMTFSLYGLTGFEVQYWTGSSWANVPGGSVTGNNLVWRKFTFSSPVITTKIRVLSNASIDNHSRLAELEAWGSDSSLPMPTNVALASNGAQATASSSTTGYSPSGAINGDRKGLNSGQNGYWASNVAGFPAWMEVNFNGTKTISEIDLFLIQNSYWAPSEPTQSMTFTYYGLTDFEVQYWTGSAWSPVTNGSVTGNNKVWRQFTFSPITTGKIRIWVTGSADGYSRIAELEAWGN